MTKPLAMSTADHEWARERNATVEMERHQADLNAAVRGAADGLEYALTAILDCHTRIVAAHPLSPGANKRRRKYVSAVERYAAVRLGERDRRHGR